MVTFRRAWAWTSSARVDSVSDNIAVVVFSYVHVCSVEKTKQMSVSFRRIFIFTVAGVLAFILIGIFGALGSAIFLGPIAAAIDVKEFQLKTRLTIISVSLLLGLLVFPWH